MVLRLHVGIPLWILVFFDTLSQLVGERHVKAEGGALRTLGELVLPKKLRQAACHEQSQVER